MSVKIENLEQKNMVKLTIEREATELDAAINKVYHKQKNRIAVPGFRKGKAPLAMIEKMYGTEVFFEDAANEIIGAAYEEAAKESGLEIVSQPEIEVTQIEKGKPFIFTATVATKPEVELGEYKGVSVAKVDTTVSEEELNNEIDQDRNKNARTVKVEDGEAVNGDETVIDFDGYVDGEQFDGGKSENYPLTLGSHAFIEGFEEQLIGMNLGEEKVINVTFPSDYMEKTLAGADVTFDVKINEIQEKQLPELDDEFVKDVSEFDTLDELKEDIKKSIHSKKEAKAISEFENDIIDTVVKNTSMDLPVEMIDSEVEHMMNEFSQGLAYQGMDIDMYLGYINKTAEEVKNEMRGEAEKRVKGSMVLEKIRDIENISYEEEQLEDELNKMAKQYNMDVNRLKEILPEEQKQYIIDSIRTKNTIDFLNKQTKRV